MNWLRKLFNVDVPECDKMRYANTERELAEAKGELRNTIQTSRSGTARLKLMEQMLALRETYDDPRGR